MSELFFKKASEYLELELSMRKSRRPSYSMRAFARDLELSPSGLNDFLKGRVGMSKARIESLASKLQWTESRKEHFADLIQIEFERDIGKNRAAKVRVGARLKDKKIGLSADEFKAISEWFHLAIIELSDCIDHLCAEKISTELKIKELDAEQAISRLIRLGLLVDTKKGLKPLSDCRHFESQTPAEAIQHFHHQILNLAKLAISEKPQSKREPHSYIFTMDTSDVIKMNREIRDATFSIINRYSQMAAKKNQIQALTVQSFEIWQESNVSTNFIKGL